MGRRAVREEVKLFLVLDASAVQVTAMDTDTLVQVVEAAAEQRRSRAPRGFRVMDRMGFEQPLDVEIRLLGYEDGQALYVRPARPGA